MINLLGVYLGDDEELMRSAPDNPEGFWERYDIEVLHEQLLQALSRNWHTAFPLAEDWMEGKEVGVLKEELANLVDQKFRGRSLWAWKDPRNSLFLPLWREVLAEAGIELVCAFAVRSPLDVAESLRRRNSFPFHKSLGIWMNYNVSALRAVRGLPTVFVSYDRVLESWESELRRCSRGLGIPWPEPDSKLRQSVSPFINPALRHHHGGGDFARDTLWDHVSKLYEALLRLCLGESKEAVLEEDAERIVGSYLRYAALFEEEIEEVRFSKMNLDLANEQLESIYRSRAWKLVTRLRKLKEMFHLSKRPLRLL
jgi:hypothetical protein